MALDVGVVLELAVAVGDMRVSAGVTKPETALAAYGVVDPPSAARAVRGFACGCAIAGKDGIRAVACCSVAEPRQVASVVAVCGSSGRL